MRQTLGKILKMHQTGNEKVEKATKEFQNRKTRSKTLEAWDRVQISRRNDRPVAGHYIEVLFQDFIELHGDRYFADDTAIVGGIATFHGRAVTVIAQAKGQNTKENIGHNFGMPSPEGYRKALRQLCSASSISDQKAKPNVLQATSALSALPTSCCFCFFISYPLLDSLCYIIS